ncbi:hypothetical protein KAU88_07355 [Candidatus Bathyarchaeota archaeon]|nr:hypothetical protein [Candidatus Bathyarchaeota archaeon]
MRTILVQESITRKQDKVNAVKLAIHEASRVKNKNELIKRLGRIQRLAKQNNYAEIDRLLQESYV